MTDTKRPGRGIVPPGGYTYVGNGAFSILMDTPGRSLPDRVALTSWKLARRNGHATHGRGSLSRLLGCDTTQGGAVGKAIERAVDHGLLKAGSTPACCIVPDSVGLRDTNPEPCPYETYHERARQRYYLKRDTRVTKQTVDNSAHSDNVVDNSSPQCHETPQPHVTKQARSCHESPGLTRGFAYGSNGGSNGRDHRDCGQETEERTETMKECRDPWEDAYSVIDGSYETDGYMFPARAPIRWIGEGV